MVAMAWSSLWLDGYAKDSNLLSAGWVVGAMAKVRILALSLGGTETHVTGLAVPVKDIVCATDGMRYFHYSHFCHVSDCLSKVARAQARLRHPRRNASGLANFELSHWTIEMAEVPFLQTLQRPFFTH